MRIRPATMKAYDAALPTVIPRQRGRAATADTRSRITVRERRGTMLAEMLDAEKQGVGAIRELRIESSWWREGGLANDVRVVGRGLGLGRSGHRQIDDEGNLAMRAVDRGAVGVYELEGEGVPSGGQAAEGELGVGGGHDFLRV